MNRHLAIVNKAALEAIFAGKKTIESRFSKFKIPPFGEVFVGDIVYLKPPGGEVEGQFRVRKVFYYQGIEPSDIDKIFKDYGEDLAKHSSQYGTLIFISGVERFITSPIKIKKSDRRGWVVLDES